MHGGRTVFAQLMLHVPVYEFEKCVKRHNGDFRNRGFSCWDQFLCLSFAQLTSDPSLKKSKPKALTARVPAISRPACGPCKASSITWAFEDVLQSPPCPMPTKLTTGESTPIFARVLIAIARPMYADEDLGFDLNATVYALDSTTIDLCLSMFPWARFQSSNGAVKMHTLLDLRGSIPTFIEVSDGKRSDVSMLDEIIPEAGSFYVMDRGYLDFERLHRFQTQSTFFVTRTKSNVLLRRRCSRTVDFSAGLISDHTVILKMAESLKHYPDALRRIRYRDPDQARTLVFLTNNFALPALTIALLYKSRWKVELFFKWIKQHLRIKAFYGTSENAVKTQIWTAIAVYVLVAIVKKRLALDASLYQILQVLSISLFEKTPIFQAFQSVDSIPESDSSANQLILPDL